MLPPPKRDPGKPICLKPVFQCEMKQWVSMSSDGFSTSMQGHTSVDKTVPPLSNRQAACSVMQLKQHTVLF